MEDRVYDRYDRARKKSVDVDNYIRIKINGRRIRIPKKDFKKLVVTSILAISLTIAGITVAAKEIKDISSEFKIRDAYGYIVGQNTSREQPGNWYEGDTNYDKQKINYDIDTITSELLKNGDNLDIKLYSVYIGISYEEINTFNHILKKFIEQVALQKDNIEFKNHNELIATLKVNGIIDENGVFSNTKYEEYMKAYIASADLKTLLSKKREDLSTISKPQSSR